jgi:hypothetical protein
MLKSILQRVSHFVVISCLSIGVAEATVIGFEGGSDPIFTYVGVDFAATPIATVSGYNNVAAFTSSTWVAYNPGEVSPSDFFLAGSPIDTFDLNSFVIAGAWGTQTLLIEGLNDAALLFSTSLAVSLTPALFTPNWSGIDQLRISIGNDFVQDQSLGGAGQHWALDNLTINQSSAVPEPSALPLLALGLAGLCVSRRRSRRNALAIR